MSTTDAPMSVVQAAAPPQQRPQQRKMAAPPPPPPLHTSSDMFQPPAPQSYPSSTTRSPKTAAPVPPVSIPTSITTTSLHDPSHSGPNGTTNGASSVRLPSPIEPITSPTAPTTNGALSPPTARPSGIPRFQSSAIPRLHQQRSPTNTRLTNSPEIDQPSYTLPYELPYGGSPIQMPHAIPPPPCPAPSSLAQRPPIDPPDLVDMSGDNAGSRSVGGHQYTAAYGRPSRTPTRPATATSTFGRTMSEHPQRIPDNDSDTSSVFSSSGTPRVITSKIQSLKNVHHKPGGGNVPIVETKISVGHIQSKCHSLANVKHRAGGGKVIVFDEKVDMSCAHSKVNSMQNMKHMPAGGQVQIPNYKLNYSEEAAPRVASMANVKHKAGGGDVQIMDEKPAFDKTASSKVGSLKNAQHRATGGNVQIFNEQLPWLKYNKPNLPPEERAKINKHLPPPTRTSHVNRTRSTSHTDINSSAQSTKPLSQTGS